jgi:putative exporter of polyketide antibiotics
VQIPAWLTIAIAAVVIIFGAYRIYLATRISDQEREQRRRSGLYTMSKRTHLFVGIIYLLLGGGLIATTFGWNPFGS